MFVTGCVYIGVLYTTVFPLLPLPHASETHAYVSMVCGVLAVVSWAKVRVLCVRGNAHTRVCAHVLVDVCACVYVGRDFDDKLPHI